LVGGVEGSNPFQVDIEETIRSRQQANGFRRGAFAELDDGYYRRRNREDGDQNREGALDPHERLMSMA